MVDLPTVEKLDLAMGLRLQPRQPLGRRTGLFLLTLRAVEFTANPIAAYPTRSAGRARRKMAIHRGDRDHTVPWPDRAGLRPLPRRAAPPPNIFLDTRRGCRRMRCRWR